MTNKQGKKIPTKEINKALLTELLTCKQEYLSGSELAEKLGVSRVSIWSHLDKLKTQGFKFSAIRNKGYRLDEEPKELHPDLLKAYIAAHNLNVSLQYHESIDSTQNGVERLLSNGTPEPVVVLAKEQTQGRGRHGRKWHSADPGNITVSIGFKPDIAPEKLTTMTPWFALNICDYLNQHLNINAKIKWPNDILLNGKKVCGMLAESRVDMDKTRDLILGIGLNVAGNVKQYPKEIRDIASSLEEETNLSISLNRTTAELIKSISISYDEFITGNYENKMNSLWNKYDALYNQTITGYYNQKEISGIAKGINNDGLLKLLLDNGQMELLNYGEVTLNKFKQK